MDIFTATMICQGAEEADQDTRLKAWQLLVDSGVLWQIQGSFGRMASDLIDQALVMIDQGLINPPASRVAE